MFRPRHCHESESVYVYLDDDDDDDTRELDPRTDLVHHSDSLNLILSAGARQLALALLADALGNDALAVALHQTFADDVIVGLGNVWSLTDDDIVVWVRRKVAAPIKDIFGMIRYMHHQELHHYGESLMGGDVSDHVYEHVLRVLRWLKTFPGHEEKSEGFLFLADEEIEAAKEYRAAPSQA
jgi:hypothetical protein